MRGFEIAMQFILFCSALFYLLAARHSVIEYGGTATLGNLRWLLIINFQGVFGGLTDALGAAISEVFVSSAKMFLYNAIFTWFSYSILGLHLAVISALLSGLCSGFLFHFLIFTIFKYSLW